MAEILEINNIGYILAQSNEAELKPIIDAVEDIKVNVNPSINNKLAGSIKNQFDMGHMKQELENIVFQLINPHYDNFPYLKTMSSCMRPQKVDYTISSSWVNFQSKYDFNPVHCHPGVLGFVIWLQIPYNIEDEIKVYKDCPYPAAGHFSFLHTNSLGRICKYPVPADRTYEYRIMLFPTLLNHCVYPFYTSDEQRISVAGNIIFKT